MISTFWGKGWVKILSQFSANFFLIAQIAGGLFGGGEGGGREGWLPASLLVCALSKQKRQVRKLIFIANTGNARRKDTIQKEQPSMASFY